MVSNSTWLPSYEDLSVPHEINLSTPSMYAAAPYMNKYCENLCKEFMLCRREERDPRKCLDLGAKVTACGVRFLQELKQTCRQEFENYSYCLDHSDHKFTAMNCRKPQHIYDECVREKMDIVRPELGYFAKPHVHDSKRVKPVEQHRDYESEAKAVSARMDIPPDQRRKDPLLYTIPFVDPYKPEMG